MWCVSFGKLDGGPWDNVSVPNARLACRFADALAHVFSGHTDLPTFSLSKLQPNTYWCDDEHFVRIVNLKEE